MDKQRLITARQADVLGVVVNNGPVTATQVGTYHLPITASSARASLSRLEQRGFVAAHYTGWSRSREYVATDAGEVALDAFDAEVQLSDARHIRVLVG